MTLVTVFTGEDGLFIGLKVSRAFRTESLTRTVTSVPTGNSRMYESTALTRFGFQFSNLINCNSSP